MREGMTKFSGRRPNTKIRVVLFRFNTRVTVFFSRNPRRYRMALQQGTIGALINFNIYPPIIFTTPLPKTPLLQISAEFRMTGSELGLMRFSPSFV